MLKVGLTGGLASGKSFVGRALEQMGCLLIKADELGHQVIQPGAEAYDAVIAEFGPQILEASFEKAAERRIDRRKLAAEVFGQPERLARLNALVHPPVRARARKLFEEFAQGEPHGIAITEAAILIETGSYRDYDKLIVAVCGEAQQVERAMERDRLTSEEVLARLKSQMPLSEKAKYADYVIDTSGNKEDTLAQTRAVYESLRRLI